MTNFFSLDGQTALVTGASRGIGASIARRLANAGAKVVLNYRSNDEAASKVLNEIQKASPSSIAMKFDIANEEEVNRAVSDIEQKFQGLQILVCNAGISRNGLLPRLSLETFHEVMNTNLLGSVLLVKAACRTMMKNRYGRIICMSSLVGEMGNKGQSAYAASKSALLGFVKSVAREFGSRNITCNAICPGFIETEMTDVLDDATKAQYLEQIPLGRYGKSEEVAAAVHYLVSQEGAYVTGATLDINGGIYMR